jgi:hypothetical protein
VKRVLMGFALAVGMLLIGVTNASASTWCTLDPTIGVGTPVRFNLSVTILGTHIYAYGDSHSTTFGGVLGL